MSQVWVHVVAGNSFRVLRSYACKAGLAPNLRPRFRCAPTPAMAGLCRHCARKLSATGAYGALHSPDATSRVRLPFMSRSPAVATTAASLSLVQRTLSLVQWTLTLVQLLPNSSSSNASLSATGSCDSLEALRVAYQNYSRRCRGTQIGGPGRGDM